MISKNLELIVKDDRPVFLIDLSWHLHRNANVFKGMGLDINGYIRPTGHLYGVLNTFCMIVEKYPKAIIIVCKDGIPLERMAVEGVEYKSDRPDLEFNFYKDLDMLEAMSYLLPNVVWAFNEDKESDDIMYALAKQIESFSTGDIFIYSGDNDLLQGISDKTCVIRNVEPKTGSFVRIDNNYLNTNEKMLEKFKGVDSEHISFYRCIVGDSSDKIKGIPRFPKVLAKDIAMTCSCLDDIFIYKGVTQTEIKYIDLIKDSEVVIRRNYSMMQLSPDIEVNLFRKKIDKEKALDLVNKFRLFSYLNKINKLEDNNGRNS